MASTLSLFFILFVAVLGANAHPLEDDPMVEKMKAIVAKLNSYVTSKGYDVVNLPNVGYRTDKLLELTNGKVGVLSSLYLQKANSVNETKQADGSTLYTFDVDVGLSNLAVSYDFDFSAVIVKEKGNFTLSVLKDSARIQCSAVVQSNGTCEGKVSDASVIVFTDFKLTVTPGSIPHVVSEAILELASSIILPSLNKLIKAEVVDPNIQDVFSSIACSVLA